MQKKQLKKLYENQDSIVPYGMHCMPYIVERSLYHLTYNITIMRSIVVYNDDYNSFSNVITTLMWFCDHSPIQAEQCAWIIHNTGKCSVKNGDYETLNPIKDYLCEAGLNAIIQ